MKLLLFHDFLKITMDKSWSGPQARAGMVRGPRQSAASLLFALRGGQVWLVSPIGLELGFDHLFG